MPKKYIEFELRNLTKKHQESPEKVSEFTSDQVISHSRRVGQLKLAIDSYIAKRKKTSLISGLFGSFAKKKIEVAQCLQQELKHDVLNANNIQSLYQQAEKLEKVNDSRMTFPGGECGDLAIAARELVDNEFLKIRNDIKREYEQGLEASMAAAWWC